MSWYYNNLDDGIMKRQAVVASNSIPSAEIDHVWDNWKKKYGIIFDRQVEEQVRKQILEKKVGSINARNKELENENASYRVDLNILSALTAEEDAQLTSGFVPLSESKRRRLRVSKPWRTLEARSAAAGAPGVGLLGSDLLPVSMDWRLFGAVTDVKSQGACGACWSFAATGALEGMMYINTKLLVSLSENQLLECDTDPFQQACGGGNFFYSFKYAATRSIATEKDDPYRYSSNVNKGVCRVGTGGLEGYIQNSNSVGTNGVITIPSTEEDLKHWVSKQPVAVAINGYTSDFKNYKEGVLDTPTCTSTVDHAVLVVGYGTTLEGIDFWLVKNSWGPGWGADGYIKIKRNAGVAGGMCGVLIQPNVPERDVFCAKNDCSTKINSQFCTLQQGCYNSTQWEEEQWFIPDSTFKIQEQIISRNSLVILACVLGGVIFMLLTFLIKIRVAHLRKHHRPVTLVNIWKTEPHKEILVGDPSKQTYKPPSKTTEIKSQPIPSETKTAVDDSRASLVRVPIEDKEPKSLFRKSLRISKRISKKESPPIQVTNIAAHVDTHVDETAEYFEKPPMNLEEEPKSLFRKSLRISKRISKKDAPSMEDTNETAHNDAQVVETVGELEKPSVNEEPRSSERLSSRSSKRNPSPQ